MKKVYRFFRSMKFGMILLVLVMLCSLAGSLIPQQEQPMTYVHAYGSSAASVFLFIGLNDVFHTWYFYLLVTLLCINLLLCSLIRFPRTLKAFSDIKKQAAEAETGQRLVPDGAEKVRKWLKQQRFREEQMSDGSLFSKNRAGTFGSFLTHLSILIVLIFGGLVLMTPQITDETIMPCESLTLSDGTEIHCLDFHIQDQEGRLDYASRLRAVSADGQQEKEQEIRVNEPLRFGEYKIYQQTYGTAGRVRIVNSGNGAEEVMYLTESCFLSIDGRNGVYFDALFPGYIKDEDGSYTLITQSSGSYTDPVYSIQSVTDGMSASVLAFPDESITIGQITFTFLSPTEYPGLRIKRVSSWLYAGLYFGFGMMVAALYLCFFAVPAAVKVTETDYTVISPKKQGLILDLAALHVNQEEEN